MGVVAVAISISPQQMQSESFSDFFSIKDEIHFYFFTILRRW